MGARLSSLWTQHHPPIPTFTERDLPSLDGKVYIVSGSNTGVGKELARVLYSKDAKVYIAARSKTKADDAIQDIKDSEPASKGELVFLHLDLADLTTIKASAQRFLDAETKLHVLFNNAGVMAPEKIQRTPQGYELNLGINNVGTFLFTKLLTPILVSTAKVEHYNHVRVIWLASAAHEMFAPTNFGITLDNLDYKKDVAGPKRYARSKSGAWALGVEFANRHRADGVISIPLNPGNLTSELFRDQNSVMKFVSGMVGYPPINGAYTELFAGLSPEVTIEKSGSWVVPFGRIYPIRQDLLSAMKSKAEGGNGSCKRFWEWCEEQVKPYL
ncbi:hypothetical protein HYALB_00000378 [Hymenoscyphus albidus]|uniref:Short-chain dehydrogenase n=1 Tax=Hymenoscyphus albidus TaxID=595503 RepID=A0A9N9LNN5_9HELO|nr:hypothetical protein HYALB_00000378 [Hymenoscyphus albidus]